MRIVVTHIRLWNPRATGPGGTNSIASNPCGMFNKVENLRCPMLKVVHSVLLLPPLYRTRRIVLGPQPNSPLIAHGHRNFPDGRRGDAVLGNIHFLTRSPASKADVTTKYNTYS